MQLIQVLQPRLEEHLGLYDTCGIHNLHGMPAIIAGFAAAIATATTNSHAYEYVAATPLFPFLVRGARTQAGYQLLGLFVSVGMGIVGGLCTGWLVSHDFFQPPQKLYTDAPYWWTEEDAPDEQQTVADARSP